MQARTLPLTERHRYNNIMMIGGREGVVGGRSDLRGVLLMLRCVDFLRRQNVCLSICLSRKCDITQHSRLRHSADKKMVSTATLCLEMRSHASSKIGSANTT